ncbi:MULTISPECIES: hypothetical protein [Mycolicibacterium]|uniref:Uncharacterized protein n=1 Tax=Mycolicibacterium senegalense TaxID=1796 RepID=A0A378W6Y9_9MYCO|nr:MULTISPECIES: hypothetical protein [Mycolicibacterium]MCV7334404.1 hypothetical protein [Mycolicibacterium senegalense]MDR7288398.1 hypothetical protein [Mycolicibacterium senegalense]QZA25346.1 hypothetical protein K3U95_04415 [Mycolicibacterium senegalense]CDP85632.1 hypothetical protein BN975_02382 [Mycolicibacterium farcinogenes]SUA28028.1 Uncharacterised protein [Mycolicibacterium senegalense]
MNSLVSSGLTACVAAATAGVIAITPVVTQAPAPARLVQAQTSLAGVSYSVLRNMDPAELAVEFGVRVSEQFAQAPLLPLVLAAQVAGGDPDRVYMQIRQIVDAPLYVADPLIEIARDTLPEGFGGGEAAKIWRDTQFWAATNATRTQIAEALGVDPDQDANYAWVLAQGLLESATRTAEGTALGAVGLLGVAQAVASGDNLAVYQAVKEYIDAPMWAADPAIEGLAQALPESLGGGTNGDPTTPDGDGAIMQFRNKQLIGARDQVRLAAANVLGVRDKVDNTGNVIDSSADTFSRTQLLAANDDNDGGKVNTLKPHVTSLNTALNDAKDKAKERRAKAKANVGNVVKKVREAAGNTAKKLGSKKSSSED